ncbi:Spore coat polysaccharide biosynthesis protein SpsC [Planktothrix tepida]|uniref:Putative uridine 5'-(Beta-1-threo-pentapyranosyl-4-ulose diphosphate) aminotransferase, PLP-dependent n=1 Tax=Planktothrix tepida PCC 9214 TaxID=671072 RepID=A0A1J1LQE1_9CYAN|nr:DegT/DnrJ/EryC1/StrS family aminotransferase [Planktothrix tepida]CAD5962006.1 Spore coat polysaccharide biosynthesis protein SpsC [Planktothrix tepida]CUR34797.1 putative uridine 5'-(Beta-1-threo-pentapyranosyl-4-ulose diphosphate) aminotransferase, PLP-dependent [Planktothrix tepida PCC 9214]
MEIRLFKPCVGEEELAKIRDVFDRAWMGLGPLVSKFEQEWNTYIGTPSSVGVNSGTAALHLALTAFNFPEGSKVLVPALTFVATATAVLYNRLEPVFVDVDRETLSLSLDDLNQKVTKDCVAVMPVHLGGHPVPMDRLIAFAKEHHLAVIEDCAHTVGGIYQGKKLGTWGDIGCFSFEEKKCMTTGDGGMICSNNPELIEPLRANRWVGIDKDTWKRVADYTDAQVMSTRHWYYEVAVLGYKYNMNDLSAAIGLAQLQKIDWMNQRRCDIIQQYLDGINDCRNIQPLYPYDLKDSSYWIFGVRCAKRDDLILHLKQKGIATGVHYMPLPLHPLFKDYNSEIPVALEVWPTMLTLPLFPQLTEAEVDYVVNALCEFDQHY